MRLENNGRVEIWRNGRKIRSFVCMDDCCEAVDLLTDSICEEPLNVGNDKVATANEFADIITRIVISGKRLMKTFDAGWLASIKSRNAYLEKLRNVFRWQPKTSCEEGIEKTYCGISQITAAKMHG